MPGATVDVSSLTFVRTAPHAIFLQWFVLPGIARDAGGLASSGGITSTVAAVLVQLK